MTATVIPLPTAPVSYITIRRTGETWGVFLVTPAGRHQFRTALARHPDKEGAITYARTVAGQMQRPLKIGGKLYE